MLRLLLNDFKWDKGRFLERFYEDTTRLLRGITCSQPSPNRQDYFDCEICMLEFPAQESIGMSAEIFHFYSKFKEQQTAIINSVKDATCITSGIK